MLLYHILQECLLALFCELPKSSDLATPEYFTTQPHTKIERDGGDHGREDVAVFQNQISCKKFAMIFLVRNNDPGPFRFLRVMVRCWTWWWLLSISSVTAFFTPYTCKCHPRRVLGGGLRKANHNRDGSSSPPPPPPLLSAMFQQNDPEGESNSLLHLMASWMDDEKDQSRLTKPNKGEGKCEGRSADSLHDANKDELLVRGGSAARVQPSSSSKDPIGTVTQYWTDQFQTVSSILSQPFRVLQQQTSRWIPSSSERAPSRRKRGGRRNKGDQVESDDSYDEGDEEAIMEKLRSIPIRHVVVPNSTVLPDSVIQSAARRSGLLGQPLRTDRVNDFARTVQRWYQKEGYVLHAVTGATLQPETGTAEIAVQEPITAGHPVGIVFCQERVIDPETGRLMTFREYKDYHSTRKTIGYKDTVRKEDLNMTYVTVQEGRTRPKRIAAALGLEPGQHFRWNAVRWQKVASSGIFSKIFQASPRPLPDGSVQLQILCTEAPSRHLEYGISRSLYTGSWEGEVDFEHFNLLGGGEVLGFTFRRGIKGPSGRLRFSDERFGVEGGYDVEVFRDFLGDDVKSSEKGDIDPASTDLSASSADHDDALVDRKGAMFRLRNPIDTRLMARSVASAAVERVTSKSGQHESIGSATLGVGPFDRRLPKGARSNMDARFTAGTRFSLQDSSMLEARSESAPETASGGRFSSTFMSHCIPYFTTTATTRQVFPLLTAPSAKTRPVVLALRHSVTASTKSLPRHEAKALGVANSIRGSSRNGMVSTAVCGTTELRIPIQLPLKTQQDASIVLFGDWMVAKGDVSSRFVRKTGVGVGLRKSLQGIPIMCNVCYAKDEGKVKTTFGLGKDFDV